MENFRENLVASISVIAFLLGCTVFIVNQIITLIHKLQKFNNDIENLQNAVIEIEQLLKELINEIKKNNQLVYKIQNNVSKNELRIKNLEESFKEFKDKR